MRKLSELLNTTFIIPTGLIITVLIILLIKIEALNVVKYHLDSLIKVPTWIYMTILIIILSIVILRLFSQYQEVQKKLDKFGRMRNKLEEAKELLDFAVSEGSEDIEDAIIQDINNSYYSLIQRFDEHSPTLECDQNDYIRFDKSYRHLVNRLHPVTISSLRFSKIIPMSIYVSLLYISLVLFFYGFYDFITSKNSLWFIIGLIGFLGVFIGWFLDLFTGVISKRRMMEIVFFSYLFIFLSIYFSVLAFVGLYYPPIANLMPQSPIGIVRGCSRQIDANWVAAEIKCPDKTSRNLGQWVVNVGGNVGPDQGATSETRKPSGALESPAGGPLTGEAALTNGEQSSPLVEIQGGLVIPLYVVVLSLIGGAVSMTRRVPEFQERVYLRKGEHNIITREHARRLLVFQILQVFTAPLIASTAYYVFKPPSPSISVLIGFASGFASEGILNKISDLIAKLSPAEAQAARPSAPTIVAIEPHQGEIGRKIRITNLAGTGFQEGANVRLERRRGQVTDQVPADEVRVIQHTKIECLLNLQRDDIQLDFTGKWDVVVTNPDHQTATQVEGFQIMEPGLRPL